jgi:hypothetical protein
MALALTYTDPDRDLTFPTAVAVLEQLHLDRSPGDVKKVRGQIEVRWLIYKDETQAQKDRTRPGYLATRSLILDAADLNAAAKQFIEALETLALTKPEMADCQPWTPPPN